MSLRVLRAGPAMCFQDLGRPGYMAKGLSCGGAADRTAIVEGAALLDQGLDCAALEMAGAGGEFEALADMRIALSGAPMRATLDAAPLLWNASHFVASGQRLSIGPATAGIYGYLHAGGGFDGTQFLGSRSAHLTAGIGALVQPGEILQTGPDPAFGNVAQKLPVETRFEGGTIRILPSVQTESFAPSILTRFQETSFTRTPRGNRQGAELSFEGEPFVSQDQLSILSQPMIAGDIQMTGAGMPFVLLPECQTTGGYPRIASVLPDDLPKVAQASPGTPLRFAFIPYEDAVACNRTPERLYAELRQKLQPLLRDPHEVTDLLSYQLISGVISGHE